MKLSHFSYLDIIDRDLQARNFLILTPNYKTASEIVFLSQYVDLLLYMCVTVQEMLDQCVDGFLRVPCRSGKRRRPSCLLGARPGHPVLPQLPS